MKMAITWTREKRKFAPLVLTGSLEECMEKARGLGYNGMELAVRTGSDVAPQQVGELLAKHGIEVSIVGTGLARAEDGLSFSDGDEGIRRKAVERLKEQIDFAAELHAPVILGLLRGDLDADEMLRNKQLEWIINCSRECCVYANACGIDVVVEPVNRYETNFLNTIQESVDFVKRIDLLNIGIMADTFHMNIEESDFAESLQQAREHLRYIHLADSNRWPPGYGHIDFARVIGSLREIGYGGYLSFECLHKPDPMTAARQAIEYVAPLIS